MTDIAAKYGVPFNTVKSWARRHWKLKKGATVAHKGDKRVQPRPHGAPKGNRNHFIHGAYVKFDLSSITEEEKELLRGERFGCGSALRDEILLCRLQQRRLMQIESSILESFHSPVAYRPSALCHTGQQFIRLSNLMLKYAKLCSKS